MNPKTKPVGKGTRNTSVNLEEGLRASLVEEAKRQGVSMGQLARAYVLDGLRSSTTGHALARLRVENAKQALVEAAARLATADSDLAGGPTRHVPRRAA